MPDLGFFHRFIPADLKSVPALLLSGAADPMVRPASRDRFAAVLGDAGAAPTHEAIAAGHSLTHKDLALAAQWLEQVK